MITSAALTKLIAKCLDNFYARRRASLGGLKLHKVLARKNPYLFKAIGAENASEIVEEALRAFVSSSDETIFGDAFFEPIAKEVSGGHVSPSEGVDVAIETTSTYTAIAVKSGPNPFNSSATGKQSNEFDVLRRRLIKLHKQFDPVLGHGYGRKQSPPTQSKRYRDSSGQEFWTELTGDENMYLKLIRLMDGTVILKHRKEYEADYVKTFNRYLREFTIDFCKGDGSIDWEKLAQYNSGREQPKIEMKTRKSKKRR